MKTTIDQPDQIISLPRSDWETTEYPPGSGNIYYAKYIGELADWIVQNSAGAPVNATVENAVVEQIKVDKAAEREQRGYM